MESEGCCPQQPAIADRVFLWCKSRSKAVIQNIKLAIASLLLLGIAVVFFSPALDLQPTTGRHPRTAFLLVAALHADALAVWDTTVSSHAWVAAFLRGTPFPTTSLVDLNCIRLC